MNNLLRQTRNAYQVAHTKIAQRLFPGQGGPVGWLVRKHVRFGHWVVPFSYRLASEGDRGAIEQVFYSQSYRVDRWPHGVALAHYFDNVVGEVQPLIIDAGANIGAASVYFSTVYPGSRIVAIEPERANSTMARLNTSDFGVKVIQCAIGKDKGILYLQDPGLSDWGFRVGQEGNYPIDVTTIDSILSENAECRPFICKIDIEGGEQDLFIGNLDWVDKFPLIILETHDWMVPGKAISRNFYQAISRRDFDILQNGENTFCFNNKILSYLY